MTTREAIEIVRDEARFVTSPLTREALLLVATIAEHHADRRKNKRRKRQKEKANG